MFLKKKHYVLLLRVVISLGLIGYFIYTLASRHEGLGGALKKITAAFSGVSPGWLILACLLHIVGFSLTSARWKILLNAQGVKTSFTRLFSYYFMAAFFNTFLPSTIGGDTIRAIESRRLTNNTSTSVMVVIIERLTGLLGLVLISSFALFLKVFQNASQPQGIWIFFVVIITGISILVGIFHPRAAPMVLGFLKKILPEKVHLWLEQAYAAIITYYKKPSFLVGAIGISIIFQFNMVVYYFFIGKALHLNPEPVGFMLKVPIMIFLLMTVPAINGIGIRTASFRGLMEFPATYALAFEFIDLAFRFGYGMMGGLLFLFHRRTKPSVIQPAPK